MKSIEHDHKHAYARRKRKQAWIVKAVRLELSIFEGSDRVLLVLVASIERCKIEIGRLEIYVIVRTRSPEDVIYKMNELALLILYAFTVGTWLRISFE